MRKSARHTRSQGYVIRTESEWTNTAAFTGVSVKDTGRSDVVRLANRDMARRAMRASKRWNGAPTKSAIHDRIARMEARRAS